MEKIWKQYKRHIIGIVMLTLFIRGSSRQFGTPQNNIQPLPNQETSNELGDGIFENISGIVLNGPSSRNRPQREHYMSDTNTGIQGRVYDITYKSAKSWMRDIGQRHSLSLIIEAQKYKQYADDLGNLQKEFQSNNKIKLLSDKNLGINNMHAKTFFGDKRRVIQTANLNRSSFESNREHFVFGTDPTIRQNLQDLFALDMQTIATKNKNKKEYLTLTERMSPNLVVCPLNCRQKIESLILSAKKSIRISAQYVTDDNIIKLLREKSNLDIRILTNDMQSNDDILHYMGNEVVRFENKKQYNHDKMMIIDNTILLIGSMNFSQNALDNNREIGIILLDPNMITQQQHLFE